MRAFHSYGIKVERTGPAVPMPVSQGKTLKSRIDVTEYDAVSLEWQPGGVSSAAVIEAKKSYGGVSGQAVAYTTAATMSESTRRRLELDTAGVPMLEIEVTTAGGTDEVGVLHLYGYTTT